MGHVIAFFAGVACGAVGMCVLVCVLACAHDRVCMRGVLRPDGEKE